MTTKLERITLRANSDQKCVFNNIGHVLDIDLLREQFHRLDGNKAVGIDKVSKMKYGRRLEENLQKLISRIRNGSYKPRASRLVEIPKEDGGKRPLAICCIEDKIVQLSVATILSAIYEPIFLPCSFGFRPGLNCHDALIDLREQANQNVDGAIVEIDIRKYFNTIPHQGLLDILSEKISDRRFIALIKVLLQTPIMSDGIEHPNIMGCPQGASVSPILANIYLHHVIDTWFNNTVSKHIIGRARIVRYADDMVFTFEIKDQAERFYQVLGKRMARFGLKLHMDKSQLLISGDVAARKAKARGESLKTFKFLGFTCYWGLARNGKRWRLKYRSRADRVTSKLKGLRCFLKANLNTCYHMHLLKYVIKVVTGWLNYHSISDNGQRVKSFLYYCKRIIFYWINRRGGRRRVSWEKLTRILKSAGFPDNWKTISMFRKRQVPVWGMA